MEAMSHEKLVLAPEITGIPELVEHQRTGFLYRARFASKLCQCRQLDSRQPRPTGGNPAGGSGQVAASYNRQRNLHAFAEQFLARIAKTRRRPCASCIATSTIIHLAAQNPISLT